MRVCVLVREGRALKAGLKAGEGACAELGHRAGWKEETLAVSLTPRTPGWRARGSVAEVAKFISYVFLVA